MLNSDPSHSARSTYPLLDIAEHRDKLTKLSPSALRAGAKESARKRMPPLQIESALMFANGSTSAACSAGMRTSCLTPSAPSFDTRADRTSREAQYTQKVGTLEVGGNMERERGSEIKRDLFPIVYESHEMFVVLPGRPQWGLEVRVSSGFWLDFRY